MRWTPERIETLKLLHARGFSDGAIALQLGKTRRSVWNKREKLGLARAGRSARRLYRRAKIVKVSDPLVEAFFGLVPVGVTHKAVADRAGLHATILHQWARGMSPRVPNFRAALQALGYDLAIVKKFDPAQTDSEKRAKVG